jgi:DNA-binding transcriptional regulator YdaS (Cro superfamily)
MKEIELRNPHVARAAALLGGMQKLADALGITRAAIYQWDAGEVPPKRALEIERVTGGEVTRHQLCPSIFTSSDAAE